MSEYLSLLVGKFAEISPWVWITCAVLLALGVLGVVVLRRQKRKPLSTKALVYGALCIAIAFVLSCIRIVRLPQGGSITLASMLPIVVYSWVFGPVAGIISGVAYGMLQLLQDFAVVHPLQLLLDYPVAFGVLGLAGCFKKHLPVGVVLGMALRFLCHFITGMVFFGEYAPEGQPVWLYSLGYNGSYMLVECIICVVVVMLPPVKRFLERLRVQARQATVASR